ncbi:hypothetical protein A9C19_11895 [Bacillus weihaiensis]|uniref:Uncharacterized protein n=1 Tax=Bacillus weihaiensis TaxID=1547283 RepID=A0A1L3MXK8_9BACI|nr:hypothetical protein A9C19_11895 [Bacillus weihaiensis]
MIKRGVLSGLYSGIILGLFLKVIELTSGLKVYTLLLNIDFIYPNPLPELVEFSLHVFVSLLIGIVFVALCQSFKITKRNSRFFLALLITFPTLFLYFPLTLLAIKETPSIDNFHAIFWWVLAHLLYAVILPIPLRTKPQAP